MATRFNITLPNGVRFTLLYNEEQSKRSLLEDLILKPWAGYCHENWLSANHGQAFAPEHKVKRLLDRCGTLLLQDVSPDDRETLSDYKAANRRSREVNMSDCPGCVLELLETGELDTSALNRDERRELDEFLHGAVPEETAEKKHKQPRRETRFDRINQLIKRFPNGRINSENVDTCNQFTYKGKRYELDSRLQQYAPKPTRYGEQYDMDRVMIIECPGGALHFADQDAHEIDDHMVFEVGRLAG